VVALFAGTQGYLDDFQIKDIRAFEVGLYSTSTARKRRSSKI